MFTTDKNNPELGHGIDTEPVKQHSVYLILSDEERGKGFIRPVRRSYVHIGLGGPKNPLEDLTEEEEIRYAKYKYVKYERYPPSDKSTVVGRFWTQEQLDNFKGCGILTTMSKELVETYARDPKFYGSTYCVGCSKHLDVAEFVWDGTNELVGS